MPTTKTNGATSGCVYLFSTSLTLLSDIYSRSKTGKAGCIFDYFSKRANKLTCVILTHPGHRFMPFFAVGCDASRLPLPESEKQLEGFEEEIQAADTKAPADAQTDQRSDRSDRNKQHDSAQVRYGHGKEFIAKSGSSHARPPRGNPPHAAKQNTIAAPLDLLRTEQVTI